jgi:hypothetical protein
VLWSSTDDIGNCCLQGKSQSSVKEAKVWELANKGTVNQNQEQKITILLKIHKKASYDQAVQEYV